MVEDGAMATGATVVVVGGGVMGLRPGRHSMATSAPSRSSGRTDRDSPGLDRAAHHRYQAMT
jgi:hypothetical protein